MQTSENGDDAFDELNRVTAGSNSGWIQVMGPLSRITQFKAIETTPPTDGLGQIRWPASNIPASGPEALALLFALPGSSYSDPEFSWLYGVAPSAIGFIDGVGLGAANDGALLVGAGATGLFALGLLALHRLRQPR